MMEKEKKEYRELAWQYGGYTLAYLFSMFCSRMGWYPASGIVLIVTAVLIYLWLFRKSGNLVELRGLFTLSWVGGQGLACFQLSRLQTDWNTITWLCFFLAYLGFGIGYEWKSHTRREKVCEKEKNSVFAGRLLICIGLLAAVSVICFIIEWMVVGFIPVFSDLPHAYSYFHVSGVHYFTISCILIPAISVLYLNVCERLKTWTILILLICNGIAVAIPILCVSRFQLLFAVGFAVVTYIIVYRKIKFRTIMILLCIMVPVYVLLTVARNHDVEYLNGIFEMKNRGTPIFVTQPYIYVANNFENFNCMVEQLVSHSWGIRMLFPVFALTGLKFVFPQLTAYPLYITKPELTTLTVFYDAYYDFGIVGILIFSLVLGMVAKYIWNATDKTDNPVVYLFYGQTAIYLGLSFFTTWFSNPTTWFWYALTAMMYFFVGFQRKSGR